MRLRHRALACLSVALFGFAKPANADTDSVTPVARQHYEQGVMAFDSKRFEQARGEFLQAYALKRHPAVLLSLAHSELRSGHSEDAGNHFQQFVREYNAATEDQRTNALRGIAEAKKKSGFLVIIVDAVGADVKIDGAAAGKAPLIDPVFVKPGKHVLTATVQGRSGSTEIIAQAGVTTPASLILGAGNPIAAAAAGAPPIESADGQSTPKSSATAPSTDSVAEHVAGASQQPGRDKAASKHPDPVNWYVTHPVAWVGTAVAGVGLGMGIGFSAAAGVASSRSADHKAAIDHAIATTILPAMVNRLAGK